MSRNETAFLCGAMRKILHSTMAFIPDSAEQKQAVASLFICPHLPNISLMYNQYSVHFVFQRAFDSDGNDENNTNGDSKYILLPSFFEEVFDSLRITPKEQKVAEDFYVNKNLEIIAKAKEIESSLIEEHARKFSQL